MEIEENIERENYLLVVPVNETGVYELNYPAIGYTENMFKVELNHNQSYFIDAALFFQYNEEFNICIDYYEEDEIKNEHLLRALEIAEKFKTDRKIETTLEIDALNKVILCLKKAIEAKTYIRIIG